MKLSKSQFACEKVHFLGHVISSKGVEFDQRRIEAIMSYPVPKNIKQLRAFLGTFNFDRRFVKDFSVLTLPLLRLLKKDKVWMWGKAEEEAFSQIKKAFLDSTILKHPNMEKLFTSRRMLLDMEWGVVYFR